MGIFSGLSCVIYISLILLFINIQGKLELLRLKLHYWIIHGKSFEEKFVHFTFNIFMIYILITLGAIIINITVLLNYLHVGDSKLYILLIYAAITAVFMCFMVVSLSPRSGVAVVALLEFDKIYNQAIDNRKIPCIVAMIALAFLFANITIGIYLTSLS